MLWRATGTNCLLWPESFRTFRQSVQSEKATRPCAAGWKCYRSTLVRGKAMTAWQRVTPAICRPVASFCGGKGWPRTNISHTPDRAMVSIGFGWKWKMHRLAACHKFQRERYNKKTTETSMRMAWASTLQHEFFTQEVKSNTMLFCTHKSVQSKSYVKVHNDYRFIPTNDPMRRSYKKSMLSAAWKICRSSGGPLFNYQKGFQAPLRCDTLRKKKESTFEVVPGVITGSLWYLYKEI